MTSNAPLVELKNVGLARDGQQLLQDISLSLQPKEIVTIIGPNGAGKTTLVKLVCGLLQPDQGQVQRIKGLRVGYMPQRLTFEASLPLTVRRFLTLTKAGASRLGAVAARLRIETLLDKTLYTLSGGELQRVLLSRALLREPELLVLDEPVQGVDVAGQTQLYELIGELRHEFGCGILMVSHDLHLVMAKTDQVICLNRHICCHGQPESVSNHPAYLELFGKNAPSIAVYSHHHDHSHALDGQVLGCNHEDHHH